MTTFNFDFNGKNKEIFDAAEPVVARGFTLLPPGWYVAHVDNVRKSERVGKFKHLQGIKYVDYTPKVTVHYTSVNPTGTVGNGVIVLDNQKYTWSPVDENGNPRNPLEPEKTPFFVNGSHSMFQAINAYEKTPKGIKLDHDAILGRVCKVQLAIAGYERGEKGTQNYTPEAFEVWHNTMFGTKLSVTSLESASLILDNLREYNETTHMGATDSNDKPLGMYAKNVIVRWSTLLTSETDKYPNVNNVYFVDEAAKNYYENYSNSAPNIL